MRIDLAAGLLAVAMSASPLAWSVEGEKLIPLKDGTSVVVFKDGKMAMRDSKGNVTQMKDGHPMETKHGQVIIMKGNEIWRKTQSEKDRADLYWGGG
jgi:hypothetical protein